MVRAALFFLPAYWKLYDINMRQGRILRRMIQKIMPVLKTVALNPDEVRNKAD